jgi:hypothetical protein
MDHTEVRYFHSNATEIALSQKAADLLIGAGIKNVITRYVPGLEDSKALRPKHLEVWFSSDAFE